MGRVKRIASQLQVGGILEDLLRFRCDERRVAIGQCGEGFAPLLTHLLHFPL